MLRHLALRRDSVLIPLPSQCHKLSLPAWLTSLTIVRDYGFELPTVSAVVLGLCDWLAGWVDGWRASRN